MKNKSVRKGRRGYTLIELMSAIAVAGTLLALAVPSFGDMIRNSRRTEVANELLTALSFARAEAAKRRQPVALCARAAAASACSNGPDWSHGWLVFADPDGDGLPEAPPLLVQAVEQPGLRITAGLSGGFLSNGAALLRPFNEGSTNGTFTICDPRGALHARAVIVALNGRARLSDRKSDGSALACP